jgi:prevent-host-death family protein
VRVKPSDWSKPSSSGLKSCLYFLHKTGKIIKDYALDNQIMLSAKGERVMVRVSASEARNNFKTTFNRVAYGHERVVVSRHKDEEVAVIPVEDLHLLERLERQAEDAIDAAAAERILADPSEAEGRVSWTDLKEELGL